MADFDPTSFFRNARGQADKGLAAAIKAVDEFGEHVLGEAQAIAPIGGGSHSPYDPAPGTLAASATSEPAEQSGATIVKVIGFNTEYAAVQHENLDFGHDQGQAKYLETPLRQNDRAFGEFVAGRVKAAVEG